MKKFILLVLVLLTLMLPTIGQWFEQSAPTGKQLTEVFFLNENIGWVATGRSLANPFPPDSTILLKTTDGGNTWIELSDDYFFDEIMFVDEQIGWAINSSELIKTIDGGVSWSTLFDQTGVEGFEFFNLTEGYLYNNQNLYITSDGGNNWDEFNLGNNTMFVDFINVDIGYSSHWGEQFAEHMQKTADGGQNWTEIGQTIHGSNKLLFIDELIGYSKYHSITAPSEPYRLGATTDGAYTWYDILSYSADWDTTLCDFHFINQTNGWTIANIYVFEELGFLINHTNNAGQSWENQINEEEGALHDIYFTDENHGWAVGENGLILHTNNGGSVGLDETPINQNVLNIFPNPTTGTIEISYEVEYEGYVIISIKNIKGQEVKYIPMINTKGGNYKLNCEEFSPGIYFVTLKTDLGILTKKLIIE